MNTDTIRRSPSAVAAEIFKHFPRTGHGWMYAQPYWQAMSQLASWDDWYGRDSGREICLYFLANAGTWRGPEARRIKAEIRAIYGIGGH